VTPSALHVAATARRGDFTLTLDLDVAPGDVVGVVGPNGSGKTTLLRVIAGLTPVSGGCVRLGSDVLDDADTDGFVPAEQRPVSFVFQDYRLFPHLSVVDNVAFGLRSRGVKRAASRTSVRDLLARLDLTDLADRRPGALSGGQAQRVALARALAAAPQVLLLDEPLSALDAQTRLDVRAGLRRHLVEFTGVCLFVTHDPLEALILADRLVVLEAGGVTQQGAPADVARRPASPYVASLVGLNLYRGRSDGAGHVTLDGGEGVVVPDHSPAGPVLLTVRPAAIAIYLEQPHHGSPRNIWPGVISSIELLTDRVRVHVDGRPGAFVDVSPAAVAELRLQPGSAVWLAVKSSEIDVYPQGT
jgi:molybdate transport system ATP-binding protein